MIDGAFIFNNKGEVLISRLFRPDTPRSVSEYFRIHVITAINHNKPPVNVVSNYSFYHYKHENLYIAFVSTMNVSVALCFELCHQFIHLCKHYFGRFNEASVKNNFLLIYELLDEIIDFGFPQITDADTLKAFMTSESVKTESSAFETLAQQASKLTLQATSTATWRRSDIKYRKNEVFLDVIEKVGFLVSSSGTLLKSSVDGAIVMKTFLSGQPECRIGLNEKIPFFGVTSNSPSSSNTPSVSKSTLHLDDLQFHACVKLHSDQDDKALTFVPPDGEFELLKYRSMSAFQIPFQLHPLINVVSNSRVELRLQIKSMFPRKFTATDLIIRIPTPLNTAQVNGLGSFSHGAGKAKYVPSENAIVWKIPRMSGNGELEMTAEAELSSTLEKKPWVRPPISIEFNISMYTVSGLQVRYLKVFEKSNYSTIKWVRYNSKSGDCQFRF